MDLNKSSGLPQVSPIGIILKQKDGEPIHSFMLTTIPDLNFDDAFEKIEWYR